MLRGILHLAGALRLLFAWSSIPPARSQLPACLAAVTGLTPNILVS